MKKAFGFAILFLTLLVVLPSCSKENHYKRLIVGKWLVYKLDSYGYIENVEDRREVFWFKEDGKCHHTEKYSTGEDVYLYSIEGNTVNMNTGLILDIIELNSNEFDFEAYVWGECVKAYCRRIN